MRFDGYFEVLSSVEYYFSFEEAEFGPDCYIFALVFNFRSAKLNIRSFELTIIANGLQFDPIVLKDVF